MIVPMTNLLLICTFLTASNLQITSGNVYATSEHQYYQQTLTDTDGLETFAFNQFRGSGSGAQVIYNGSMWGTDTQCFGAHSCYQQSLISNDYVYLYSHQHTRLLAMLRL